MSVSVSGCVLTPAHGCGGDAALEGEGGAGLGRCGRGAVAGEVDDEMRCLSWRRGQGWIHN